MKKPFKIAAYSFMIFLILGLIFGFLFGPSVSFIPIFANTLVSIPINLTLNLISAVLAILIFYGFILLGKKVNNMFLIIMSWIGIVIIVMSLFYLLFGNLIFDVPNIQEKEYLIFILIVHIIYSIVLGINAILFGIALLKISKKIKYAKSAGILNIITGATLIIGLGYVVVIAADIMEIFLFFEASKRFETSKNEK